MKFKDWPPSFFPGEKKNSNKMNRKRPFLARFIYFWIFRFYFSIWLLLARRCISVFRCRATKSPYFSFTSEENVYTSGPSFEEETNHLKRWEAWKISLHIKLELSNSISEMLKTHLHLIFSYIRHIFALFFFFYKPFYYLFLSKLVPNHLLHLHNHSRFSI